MPKIKIPRILPFALALAVCFYLLSPLHFWEVFIFPNQIEKIVLSTFGALILTMLFCFRIFVENKDFRLKITHLDSALIIYLLFVIFHAIFIKPVDYGLPFVAEFFGLLVFYVFFRNINPKQIVWFYLVFFIAGAHQIVYGIAEQTRFFAPGYGLADIQGSFINQGLFSGFIAGISTITAGLIIYISGPENLQVKTKHKSILLATLIILIVSLIGFFTVLYATQSRAAWLGALAGILFIVITVFKRRSFLNNFFTSTIKRVVFYAVSFAISVILLYSLYDLKKDSANGRLLIWKISSQMIEDEPLLGHGTKQFQANYMNYQAEYFKVNPNSPYNYLADNNRYVFNEILRIATEQGIVGLFIALLVVVSAFKKRNLLPNINKEAKHVYILSAGGLLTILIFGLFSYPNEVLPIKFICAMFLAAMASQKKAVFEIQNWHLKFRNRLILPITKPAGKMIAIVLLIVLPVASVKVYNYSEACKTWNKAFKKFNPGTYESCVNSCKQIYPLLKNNGDFLGMYGKALVVSGKHNDAIKILNRATKFMPSTYTYVEMGKSYEELGQYGKAEKAWLYASDMVPSKFYPKYLLAKMYENNGQKQKAKQIAQDLLSKKIKVFSIAVHEIIEELKEIAEVENH